MQIGGWQFGTWQVIGYIGQACFFSRFCVQWYVSERLKKSVIPLAFWYLSLIGTSILLIYAISQREPVFTLGQACGFFIYIRNLMLIDRAKKGPSPPTPSD
jgi:lipid-A-disaccharide synthase-like uncharacterized protein